MPMVSKNEDTLGSPQFLLIPDTEAEMFYETDKSSKHCKNCFMHFSGSSLFLSLSSAHCGNSNPINSYKISCL